MKLAIYGTGGNGREVAAMARRAYGSDALDLTFVTDEGGEAVGDIPHVRFDELSHEWRINVSVALPQTRRALVEMCEAVGFGFQSLRAPTHVDYGAEIGEGALLCDFTLTTVNVRIGRHFHANYYSQVSHDCVIGDFVTFGPGVRCNGNVTIEDEAYIGAGALIRQGLTIGRGAVVGMGAVVVRDVEPGAVVVGNPARARAGL